MSSEGKKATSRNQEDALAFNKIGTKDSLGVCHIRSCLKPKSRVPLYDFEHTLSNNVRKNKFLTSSTTQ